MDRERLPAEKITTPVALMRLTVGVVDLWLLPFNEPRSEQQRFRRNSRSTRSARARIEDTAPLTAPIRAQAIVDLPSRPSLLGWPRLHLARASSGERCATAAESNSNV